MKESVTTRERYKMYKKGKFWLFAGLVTLTCPVGIVAHADTAAVPIVTDASSTSATDQSHVTESSVNLDSRAANSGVTATADTSATAVQTTSTSASASDATDKADNVATSSSTASVATSINTATATTAAASLADSAASTSTVVTSASSDDSSRVAAASSMVTSTAMTKAQSATSVVNTEASTSENSDEGGSAATPATAPAATNAKIIALDATVSTSDSASAAKDYADYHASTNLSSGIFGTSEWWVDEDEVLHIGGGTLGATNGAEIEEGILADGGTFSLAKISDENSIPWYVAYDGNHPENANSITKIVFEDPVVADSDASGLFYGMANLTSIENLRDLDTSHVTNMAYMFAATMKLSSLDLSNFDTSLVTNMSAMFAYYGYKSANPVKLNVSSFDTTNVTDMTMMFMEIGATDLDLSNFDTSNVQSAMLMFTLSANLANLNVASFTTENLRWGYAMFDGCPVQSLDLSGFDMSKIVLSDVRGMGMLIGTVSLTSLTLNPKAILTDNDSTPTTDATLYDPKLTTEQAQVYTGKWMNQTTKATYTAAELMALYTGDGSMTNTYTYVWQPWIDTQATTLVAGPTATWEASDNFISAIDPEQASVALGTGTNDVTYAIAGADGQAYANMPTNTPGIYTVTYSFVDNGITYQNTATVTIVASQANLTTADSTMVATTNPDAKWTPSDNVTGILDNTGQTIDFASANITVNGGKDVDLSQVGTYPVTYTYTDASGNQYTKVATITVTANNSTINASDSTIIAGPSVTWTAEDNLAGAVDTTGDEATATTSDTVDSQTPGTYHVTYNFIDSTGSPISKTVIVTVVASAAKLTVKDSTFVATTNPTAEWTASDNVTTILDSAGQSVDYEDANITVAGADKVDLSKAGTYLVTYTYTDASGNKKAQTATITVTTNHSIIDANDSTLIAGPATTWTASDNLRSAMDTDGTHVNATTSDTVNPQKPGKYNVRYMFTDSTGSVITKMIVVTVKASQASITAADSVINRGATWQATDNLINVLDAQGQPLSVNDAQVVTVGTVDADTPGTYHVTYQYTDVSGNVVSDEAAVVVTGITLKENAKTIVTTSTWQPNDSIASAINAIGADATAAVRVTITNAVGATVGTYTAPGQYLVAYKLNGQTTALALTVTSDAKITASGGAVILDGDWSTLDNLVAVVDENGQPVDLTDARITAIGTVDTTTPGSYHVSYQYTDTAGNVTISDPVTVNVTGITLKSTEKTISTTSEWTPIENIKTAVDATGANAIGNVMYTVSAARVRSRSVAELSRPGEYTVTYSFTDQLGTHTASMTVNVISDARVEVKDSTITVGDQWTSVANLTRVLDENGNQISLTDARITTRGGVNTMTPGQYHVTYTYTDAAGNTVLAGATVTVVGVATDNSGSNDDNGGTTTDNAGSTADTDTNTDNAGSTADTDTNTDNNSGTDDHKDLAAIDIDTAEESLTDTDENGIINDSDTAVNTSTVVPHQQTSAAMQRTVKVTATSTIGRPRPTTTSTQPVVAAALPQTDETKSTNTLAAVGMLTLVLSGLLGLSGWHKRGRKEH